MSINPLKEKGMPIEKQLRNWSDLNVKPYNKKEVHPYTRTRVILMNGIEVEGAIFTHQFARHSDDMELKKKLAMARRVEQQQQKAVNWLVPGNETVLEVTIGFEQVANVYLFLNGLKDLKRISLSILIVPVRNLCYSLSLWGRVGVGVNDIMRLSFPPLTPPRGREVSGQALITSYFL